MPPEEESKYEKDVLEANAREMDAREQFQGLQPPGAREMQRGGCGNPLGSDLEDG